MSVWGHLQQRLREYIIVHTHLIRKCYVQNGTRRVFCNVFAVPWQWEERDHVDRRVHDVQRVGVCTDVHEVHIPNALRRDMRLYVGTPWDHVQIASIRRCRRVDVEHDVVDAICHAHCCKHSVHPGVIELCQRAPQHAIKASRIMRHDLQRARVNNSMSERVPGRDVHIVLPHVDRAWYVCSCHITKELWCRRSGRRRRPSSIARTHQQHHDHTTKAEYHQGGGGGGEGGRGEKERGVTALHCVCVVVGLWGLKKKGGVIWKNGGIGLLFCAGKSLLLRRTG